MKKNLLIIFVRHPELGKVKTRLAKDIGKEKALVIYKFLLKHTLFITQNLSMEKEVWYAEEIRENDIWDPEIYTKKKQRGKDLGERMENAFAEGFQNGFEKIAIIGSDIRDLASEDILTAFEKLDEHDVVIGPADDGGYYLLGMKNLHSQIFKEKNWGTNRVLKATLADLKSKDVHLLETRHDVDVFKDVEDVGGVQQFL